MRHGRFSYLFHFRICQLLLQVVFQQSPINLCICQIQHFSLFFLTLLILNVQSTTSGSNSTKSHAAIVKFRTFQGFFLLFNINIFLPWQKFLARIINIYIFFMLDLWNMSTRLILFSTTNIKTIDPFWTHTYTVQLRAPLNVQHFQVKQLYMPIVIYK